jgi:glycosyltransferase involved in cell wall biosynthesis
VATVFFAFRDVPERRAALRAPQSLDRYRLFGLDELARRGVRARHNLERGRRAPLWARRTDWAINALLYRLGGYGGDFASVLASLRVANASDVVFSTVDTVGIPLMLLKQAGLLRPPLVYTAVGLPERLVQLRGDRARRLYAAALRRAHAIIAYSQREVDALQSWLGSTAPPIRFVPFGVDVNAFRPDSDREPEVDVVSVGADPRRDLDLLVDVASRREELSFRIVTTAERARSLRSVPSNVAIETDIPLEQVRARLADARVVALPVRDNTYTGATTVLLQAMAMAKPVVVSRTDAIARGYGLEDRVNVRLVEPADPAGFERVVLETLTSADAGVSLGLRARKTVERELSWEHYTRTLWEILSAAASGAPSFRRP